MGVTRVRPSTQLRAGEIVLPDEPNVFTDVNTFTGIRFGTLAIGEDYAMTDTDFEVLVDASSAPVTITLPAALGSGQFYHIKKIDDTDNVVTVAAAGSDLIDDSSSLALIEQWSDCTLIDAAFAYWDNAGGASAGGGGATIDATTNLIAGDGAGNGVDAGIDPVDVVVKASGATPTTLNEVIALLQSAGLCSAILFFFSVSAFGASFGDIPANLTMGAGTGVRRNAGNTLFEAFTPATGTVTSVGIAPPSAGITVAGSPITTSGSITLSLADDLAALEALSGTNTIYYRSGTSAWSAVTIGTGLDFTTGTLSATGAGFVPTSRTLTIGPDTFDLSANRTFLANVTNVAQQPLDADLTTIAGLTATTDNFMVSVASNWASRTPTQVRSTLGLVIGTNVQAWDADLDSWAAVTRASGFDTFTATPSSANLRSLLTDENGTGAALFNGATAPDFTTGFTIGTAASSGKIPIGNGANYVASTPTYPNAASTTGKHIKSDGTNFVTTTATISDAPSTALKWLRSDGTNWITSTSTLSDTPSTAGKVVVSDGTNWITSTPTFPNASASSGKFIRSDGTNWIASTPTLPTSAGSSGKILVSDATNYIESTPTFPNASATSGKVIKSDGTNWVASTETYAAPSTAGNVMISDGTNWTSAAQGLYAGASPPTTDVGVFTIAKTGIDLKTAGTTAIFTVPTSRSFVCIQTYAIVTAVTSGGAGTLTFQIKESGANAAMSAATTSNSSTPAVGNIFTEQTTMGGSPYKACAAAANVNCVVSTSNAGSTAVTGTVYVIGFYTQ